MSEIQFLGVRLRKGPIKAMLKGIVTSYMRRSHNDKLDF